MLIITVPSIALLDEVPATVVLLLLLVNNHVVARQVVVIPGNVQAMVLKPW